MASATKNTGAAAESTFRENWGGCRRADGLPAVPLVLGVVGHRNVRPGAGDGLKDQVRRICNGFRAEYSDTPLVVMSALAQGADQVAARVALEAGAWVRAPLPFAPATYRASTSFDDDASREELDRLLKHPRVEWFVLPLPDGTVPDESDHWRRVAAEPDEAFRQQRHTLYANAGGYIVRRCHALIALWDGTETGGSAGTAEQVGFKLHGVPSPDYPWIESERMGFRGERGLVLVVHTPRSETTIGDIAPGRPPGDLRVLVPHDPEACAGGSHGHDPWTVPASLLPLPRYLSRSARLWSRVKQSLGSSHGQGHGHGHAPLPVGIVAEEVRQFRETCTVIEDFNRDIARPFVRAALATPSRDVADLESLHLDDRHACWLEQTSRLRDAAGAASRAIQPSLDWALAGIFLMLGLSVLSFHIYAHWFEVDAALGHTVHSPFALLAFLGLLAATVFVVLVYWWLRLEQRRLDSRALAEALRVRRAWSIAGIGRSVAASYLGQLRGEMSWMRQAVRHVGPPAPLWALHFASLGPEQQGERLSYILENWVGRSGPGREPSRRSQLHQYCDKCRSEHARATRLRRLGLALAVTGWALLGALLVREEWARHPWHPYLILSGTLVLAGGLLVAYCERRSHEELAKQYERMALVFNDGSRVLEERIREGDVPGAQHVIEELGREAIMEHSQWLILRRARPLELPLH